MGSDTGVTCSCSQSDDTCHKYVEILGTRIDAGIACVPQHPERTLGRSWRSLEQEAQWSCPSGGRLPGPVIRLDPGAGHSCLHPSIPISSALGRRDVSAFGSSASICPYYYGRSMCSPVICLDVLLPSGEQGLLISSLLRLFEHQGGHGDLAVLGSTYIVLATLKKTVGSPCTFVPRNICYDGA